MWFMTFRIALRALGRNKLRSFLTMLGIIIGVGAVIAMVAIGEGAKATIRSQIASLGTNVLIVLPGTATQKGVRTGSGGVNTLVDSDAKAMTQEIQAAAFASPIIRRPDQIVAGNLNWSTLTQSVAPEFQQIREWQVAKGRFLHERDMESAAKVAVSAERVQEVQEQITALLRQRHRIGPDREDDFMIRNLSDIAEAASTSARVMAVLLGSVASISLLVGGIGIMNIMLVSVTERTR